MRAFEYSSPSDTSDVVNEIDALVRPYAGGTDLLTRMKADITTPKQLVDIKKTDLPSGVKVTPNGLTLGALTPLSEIEFSQDLSNYALLKEAAALIATPQLRNRATLGGTLLQRPRCWYYRSSHINCWLKGGEGCPAKEGQNEHHALFSENQVGESQVGESPCVAVHPSDLASCLNALDATVKLRGSGGERELSITEFYQEPDAERRKETVIEDDELITELNVPAPPAGTRSTYLKAMDRKVWAFALVGVAAVLRIEDNVVQIAQVTLSGVANIPWRLSSISETLIGQEVSEDLFEKAAENAVAGATALEHNAYKIPLAKRLIKRALMNLADLDS